eukprot:m.266921 g.266921  ORF g.266921 m.266921 type:complete len:410 (-) comp70129_c0_seq1:195-1424(-)
MYALLRSTFKFRLRLYSYIKTMSTMQVPIDPEVKNKSLEQLDAHIKQVSKAFPSLYDRTWTKTTVADGEKEDEDSFLLVQFNILAEFLSLGPNPKPMFKPTSKENLKTTYGNFDAVPKPEVVFNFQTRKYRLLEEITRQSAAIITLQEVDHFYDFFEPALLKYGYAGLFQHKASSDAPACGWTSDGVAVFWKTDEFKLQKSTTFTSVKATDGSDVKSTGLIASLVHKKSKRELTVVTTHLKAGENQENEDKRKVQMGGILDLISRVVDTETPMVFAGDFNTESFNKIDKEGLPLNADTITKITSFRSPKLQSAYPLASGDGDSVPTTWKLRKGKEYKRCIDYVFFSGQSLGCLETLKLLEEGDVEPTRLPGLRYPSDHVCIGAKLKFLHKARTPQQDKDTASKPWCACW